MKRILSCFFIGLFFASFAQAIQVGDPENEVTIVLGNPVAVRKKSDNVQVWKFKDGTTVWLADGVVQKIAGPTTGSSIYRSGSIASTIPSSNAVVSSENKIPAMTSSTTTTQGGAGNRVTDDMENVGYFVLFGGLAVILVSKIRFWMIVFRTSGWWLLGCVFVPFVSLLFVFTHWRETKKVFAWQTLVALPLIVIGIYLTPTWLALERGSFNF